MIPFAKYTGAGNDFVVVEAGDEVGDPRRLARALCPRSTGAGVDGMALVDPAAAGELHVRFFNPDGTEFAVCGNGSRCVARWAADAGLDRDGRVTLVSDAGRVEARVDGRQVTLDYALPARVEGRRTVPFAGEDRQGWLVRMGTPHFVLPLEEMPDGPIDDLCRPVRHHASMGPEGANVDLVAPADDGGVRLRTFERGVEGETLACGAGAMSAALALHEAGRSGPHLRVETQGGAVLRVAVDPGGPAAVHGSGDAPSREGSGDAASGPCASGGRPPRRLRLTGPARFVFRGAYPPPGSAPRRRDGADRGAVGTPGG